MKIGFDAKRLYHNFTGLGNYARSLVSGLQELYPQHEYTLFTPTIRRTPETSPFLDSTIYRTISPKRRMPSAIWRTFGIKHDIRRSGVELYHGLSHELPVGIERLSIPSVVSIHDLIFKRYPQLYPLIDRQIYDWKFRTACERADTILTISESTKRDIIEFYDISPQKIVVSYLSCHQQFWDMQHLRHCQPDTTISVLPDFPAAYLLYVGTVNERKNLLRIVQAMQHISPRYRLPLVVLGTGRTYFKKVMNYIKTQQMEDWVHVKKIAFSDFPAAYHHARALVYPSQYEGFGMPILEAQLCGTPSITCNLSSLPEVGGEAALYVSPTDPVALAAAIQKISRSDDLHHLLVERGDQHSQRFTPSSVSKKVIQTYHRLLGE